MQTINFRAMGSEILIALDSDSVSIGEVGNQAAAWFEEWEQVFSRFRLTSELTEVNRHTGQYWMVSRLFWEAYLLSVEIEKMTDGLVTPKILNGLESAGYTRSFEEMAADMGDFLRQSYLPTDYSQEIKLDEKKRSIYLPSDVHLDFGGIIKGWAARQTMLRLQPWGPVMVDAGGDISISGPLQKDAFWPIGIADPFHEGRSLSIMMLHAGGIATSGKDYRRWRKNGKFQHHIIDPRINAPAETDILTATVIAADVIQAEAWAKTAVILGSDQAVHKLENIPGLDFFFLLDDGNTIESPGFGESRWSEKWQIMHNPLTV